MTHSSRLRRAGRVEQPVAAISRTDYALRSFGRMPEPWCKLLYFEGNADQATFVADHRLPIPIRPTQSPLEFVRQELLLGRDLPEGSLRVILGASVLKRMSVATLISTANFASDIPAIDLRAAPDLSFSHDFESFAEPPTNELPSAFVQNSFTNIQRHTGPIAEAHTRIVDRIMPNTLSHQESITYMTDLALTRMLQ